MTMPTDPVPAPLSAADAEKALRTWIQDTGQARCRMLSNPNCDCALCLLDLVADRNQPETIKLRAEVEAIKVRAVDAHTDECALGVIDSLPCSCGGRVLLSREERDVVVAQALAADLEAPVCAAIRLPDGYIVRGHRHYDCLRSAAGMERFRSVQRGDVEQGFVTSRGRFVNCTEGARLFEAAGGTLAHPPQLYSEDLY